MSQGAARPGEIASAATAAGAAAAGRPGIGAFVRRKRAAWERLAALTARLGSGGLGLEEVEELDRLYRRAVGDLAWARTAFPGSDLEGYLSQVTARSYAVLYRRRSRPGRLRAFVREEIPAAFARHRRAFAFSGAVLLGGIAAGALAVALDPGAAATLVPRPVRNAVASGRMWTDSLLEIAPGLSGSFIARNNVAAIGLVFALGLTGGLGTAWLLFANGLLLGAVAAYCVQRGMGRPLLGFVAAHGPAELLCLILAGQAGFLLAAALVDPGEDSRGEALARAGREAARLIAAAVPLLLVVGLVEGAISPGALFPLWAKAVLGASLAGAALLYLFWPAARAPARA
ncbi:MAG TPA: stage II sporulation protein M [Anaeromyxobacteraceae bacterium]|nr:stage II sporulation protein M [Anaeromyxobacteraceae bacterium]